MESGAFIFQVIAKQGECEDVGFGDSAEPADRKS